MLENVYKSTNELVSRGQTAILLQGVIAFSISAYKIIFMGAYTENDNISVFYGRLYWKQ